VILAIVIIALVVFAGAFWLSGVTGVARETLMTAKRAAMAMRDPGLDDSARESTARRAALRLGALFTSMMIRTAIVVASALTPIWLAGASGVADADSVAAALAGWQTGVVATLAAVGAYLFWTRVWPTS
jgi:hypothetical protein